MLKINMIPFGVNRPERVNTRFPVADHFIRSILSVQCSRDITSSFTHSFDFLSLRVHVVVIRIITSLGWRTKQPHSYKLLLTDKHIISVFEHKAFARFIPLLRSLSLDLRPLSPLSSGTNNLGFGH